VITYLNPQGDTDLADLTGVAIFNSGQIDHPEQLEQDVNIFEWQDLSIPIVGKRMSDQDSRGWIRRRSSQIYAHKKSGLWLTDIDIIANIFYHLSRYEEKWRHFAEETASDYTTSLLSRYHNLKVPVVDILLKYLQFLLEEKGEKLIRILPWPEGQPFAAALTHDVDLTRGVSMKRRLYNTGLGLFKNITGNPEVHQKLQAEMKEEDEQVWSFPQLMELYEQYHINTTFFFLSRMLEGLHFRYNIKSKKFSGLIRSLQDKQHEVGLHSSLRAFDYPSRYKAEKEKLEDTCKTSISGLRQHYLRGKYPRLWRIAARNGFRYDSSLGYNYQAGYRAGTTHPFYAYDYDREAQYDLIEFSLVFFEYNLPRDEDQLRYIQDLMTQTREFGGLLVALLHPSNFRTQPFHDMWITFIQRLKAEGACVNTLGGHYNWRKSREQITMRRSSQNSVVIEKPAQVNKFSISLHNLNLVGGDKSTTISDLKNNCYCLQSEKQKISIKVR
jgi:peptidoglycan/xylan/chitin deacetylase (PgdA/CDA1 family)